MKITTWISFLIIAVMSFLLPQHVDATSYRQQKELVKEKKSEVFESFIRALPDEKLPEDTNASNDDYSNLISKYESESSKDTIKSISELFPFIDPSQVNDFSTLDQKDLLKKVSKGLNDRDILNLLIVRSNLIAKAREEWTASLNLYPQTVYLQDLLKTYQAFTEGTTIGIGKEYQQDMIQMYYPSPGMTGLRGRIVDADVRMAWLDFLAQTRDVLVDGQSLLAEIRKQEDMISIYKESASLIGVLSDVTRVQYKTGTRSFADAIRIETELDAITDSINRMTSMQEGSISKLLSMLDLPVDADFGSIKWTLDDSPDVNINQLRNELPDTSQELQKLALQVEKMDTMIKMARIGIAPDKTLGFTYFQGRDVTAFDSKMQAPGIKDSTGMTSMGSNNKNEMPEENFMSTPMVDYREMNFALDSSWATELVDQKNAMVEMLKADSNMKSGMLEMTYKDYTQMIKSEKLYNQQIIPKAKAALDVVRRGYSSNENDFSDLISSEQAYLMARMELVNTTYERRVAQYEMVRSFGRNLDV
jgi:hypothetical protein